MPGFGSRHLHRGTTRSAAQHHRRSRAWLRRCQVEAADQLARRILEVGKDAWAVEKERSHGHGHARRITSRLPDSQFITVQRRGDDIAQCASSGRPGSSFGSRPRPPPSCASRRVSDRSQSGPRRQRLPAVTLAHHAGPGVVQPKTCVDSRNWATGLTTGAYGIASARRARTSGFRPAGTPPMITGFPIG